MSKTITFEFWRLVIIDEKNDVIIPFKTVLDNLEKKPLKLSDDNHRYYCHNKLCYRAISYIEKFNNGKLISFSKYENQNIKGGFLENGAEEFDAIKALKDAINRNDVAIKEYNKSKIFDSGVVIFQANKKANTMKHLKEYLEFHCENNYKIEIIPIYQNELFDEIDNGNVHQIELQVGFNPNGSFNHFDEESYSGAVIAELKLKKGKDNFLKKAYIKSILFAKKLKGFGNLDKGIITNAKATIANAKSGKKILVSLDKYQLKEKKVFENTTFYDMDPNKYFDEIYNKYKDFLSNYIQSDTRYS